MHTRNVGHNPLRPGYRPAIATQLEPDPRSPLQANVKGGSTQCRPDRSAVAGRARALLSGAPIICRSEYSGDPHWAALSRASQGAATIANAAIACPSTLFLSPHQYAIIHPKRPSSADTYPVSGQCSGQDGGPRVLILISTSASIAIERQRVPEHRSTSGHLASTTHRLRVAAHAGTALAAGLVC